MAVVHPPAAERRTGVPGSEGTSCRVRRCARGGTVGLRYGFTGAVP